MVLMLPTMAFAATTVTINSRCGIEGAQAIVTLNKGQEIHIAATATGNDGTHEDEALSVFAVGHRFIRIVTANTGTHRFEYEANQKGVEIDACWSLVRNDDDSDDRSATFFVDHVATVTYRISS